MAGDVSYGAGGGNLDDLTRRAQKAIPAVDELKQAEERRTQAEERGTQAEEHNREARGATTSATDRLSEALHRNLSRLESETSAVRANTAAWRANAEARSGAAARRPPAPTAAPEAAVRPAASLADLEATNQRLQAERRATPSLATAAFTGFRAPPGGFSTAGTPGRPPAYEMPAAGSNAFAQSQRATAESTDKASESISRQGARLAELRAQEASATREVNEAGAAYANYSTSLTRHGALTTEFIQAFARGQVTLKEFESQMLSTIGKFGGWVVAGAAVYGLFDALKHVKEGATETQAAVLNLGRFLPGLGGPAGGGRGQVPYVESQLRGISTQFNLPIKDVADAMGIMSRTFHNVTDAAEATRAVLAAYRLDQINQSQAEQYLTGIAHSFGLTTRPEGEQGQGLTQVVNALNALQNTLGARVTQTLPAIARAAPAALAEGVSPAELEAMAGLGVASGQSGNQVGTALLRSMTRFAWQGGTTFREYGITPQIGQYGDLFKQVIGQIDTRQAQGRPLSGVDLQRLAQALGGPQQGSRGILPLLLQEQLAPGTYGRALGTTQRPPSYQKDLDQVLGSVSERFKAIGIDLENFGSRIGPAVLQPLVTVLGLFGTLAHVMEGALSPFARFASALEQAPGPLRDLVGLFIALRVGMRLYQSQTGQTAQGFIGRLPGLGALGPGGDRAAVSGTLGRLQTYLQPQAQREAESAILRQQQASQELESARRRQTEFEAQAAVAGSNRAGHPDYEGYVRTTRTLAGEEEAADKRVQTAAAQRQDAEERAARITADIAVLKDSQLSTDQKISYLKDRQYILEEELTSITQERVAQARAAAKAGTTAFGAGGAARGVTAAEGASFAPASGVVTQEAARARASASRQAAADLERIRAINAADAAALPQTEAERFSAKGYPGASQADFPVAAGIRQRLESELTGDQRTWREKGAALASGASEKLGRGAGVGYGGLATGGGLGGRLSGASLDSLASPGVLLAATLGTALLGGALQGVGANGVGNFISGVVGQGTTGALLGSFIKPGNLTAAALGAIFGTVAGSFEQGGGSQGFASLAGGVVGAGIGGVLGDLPGAAVGGAVGSTVGSALGSIFGDHKSSAQQLSQTQKDARTQLQQLRGSRSQIEAFGDQFSQDLQTAFGGNSDAAQKAQAKIQTQIQQLTAEIQLFGRGSPQGKAAFAQLNTVVGAALDQATTDPNAAKQILDTVDSAQTAVVQRRFQYLLANAGPGQAGGAVAAVQPDLFATVRVARQHASDAEATLRAAQQNERQVAAGGPSQERLRAQKGVRDAQDVVNRMKREGLEGLDYGNSFTEGNALTDALGITDSSTGRPYDQALKGLDTAKSRLRTALGKSASQQKKDAHNLTVGAAAAAAADKAAVQKMKEDLTVAQQQLAKAAYQQDIADITAAGTLSQARAGADPQAQLRAQLRTQQQELQRTTSDKRLDPATKRQQTEQLRAQSIETQQKLVQGQVAVIQSQGAVSESLVSPGDQVGQLRSAYDSQRRVLNYMQQHSHDFDPSAIRSQVAATNNAWKQWYEGVQNQAGQLAEIAAQTQAAHDFGDSVAQAYDLLQGAINAASHAVGPVAKAQAAQQVAERQGAYQQAQFARIASETALAQAQHPGDLITDAQIAKDGAQRELAMAHGTDQINQAERDLATANEQLANARATRFQELGALKASETVDPIKQLQAEIDAQAKALSVTVGKDSRIKGQTDLNNLKIRYNQELASTRESTIQFQFDMMQISAQQAIHQLQDLLKLKNLTKAQRQQILEEIRRFQLGQESPLGAQGGFDLAPGGNIRLPTYYDVAHAIRGRQTGLSHDMQVNAPTQINVYVGRNADVGKVSDAIDRATGSHLHHRLRAAGVR